MKSIGIKKLKNELSRYLKFVREGEIVYVTDRDEVIAEIHKPTTPVPILDLWETYLNQMERSGVLRRAKRSKGSAVKGTGDAGDWEKILDEMRNDRF